MDMKGINEELNRFRAINKYGIKLISEQEPPIQPAAPPAPGGEELPPPPGGEGEMPPEGASEFPAMSGDTEAMPEVSPEMAGEDDDTEEMDITDLVNMTKSIKKQLDDVQGQGQNTDATQKMDDIFNKLGELETKLSEMDNVIAKIDKLGAEIEQAKPKTPMEKLEMRSLDSYPFSKNPSEFFNEKQQEMKASGKNEYVLTKNDVENYGKYEIMKSFNPKAEENDYMF